MQWTRETDVGVICAAASGRDVCMQPRFVPERLSSRGHAVTPRCRQDRSRGPLYFMPSPGSYATRSRLSRACGIDVLAHLYWHSF